MFTFITFLLYLVITLFAVSFVTPTPISDMGNVRYKSIPYMTILLIVINSLVFMLVQASN